MSEVVQYLIIFVLFVGALYVILKPFPSKKDKSSGCGKGCSCSFVEPSKEKAKT